MPIYKLNSPRKIGATTISEIEFVEVSVDQVIDLADLDTQDLRALKAWLANAIDVDATLIGKLTIGDFKGLVDAVTGPLPEALGEGPSPLPQS